MARPSTKQIDDEIVEAIEEATLNLFTEMWDHQLADRAVLTSPSADRAMRIRAATRTALARRLSEELNDRLSDLRPEVADVRTVLEEFRR